MSEGRQDPVLGDERARRLYLQVLPGSNQSVQQVAASLLIPPEQLLEELRPLIHLHIVTIEDGVLHVVDPITATRYSVAEHAARLARASHDLSRIADALPALSEIHESQASGDDGTIDGDVSPEGDVPSLITRWIRESRGDLCFLRPDQWRLPSESEMAVAVGNAIRDGARVRAIYPARALTEAPHILRTRIEMGEEIKIVPNVFTRMVIVGPRRAIIPEPLGVGSDHRVVIRQPAIVGVFQAYFDHLWESASLVGVGEGGLGRLDERRLLLAALADGVKDEQVARDLDLSLRTVRRRVAALMSELGVDTRFQAGVEAARRGWL